jgi:Xaa-Pro aminopeptidase
MKEVSGMSRHRIEEIQVALRAEGIDGWLFFSFRGSDPIALNVLGLDRSEIATRRWAYFVPATGEPRKVVHVIEPHALDTLPGRQRTYLPWQQLHGELNDALDGARRVAMQYSPMNAIPYISRVDAGTVELVQSFGVEVVSSADLVQVFEAVWTSEQLESHRYAARHLREIVDVAFREVARRVGESGETDEYTIQEFIWREFASRGLLSSDRPIVAVNAHSADPHYAPTEGRTAPIRAGDFLLVDIWAKRPDPGAVYADITWTGFVGASVPGRYEEIFQVVRAGRDAAIGLVRDRGLSGMLHGWEVDDVARNSISAAGYGEYFIHRTGHSIHEEDHGNGANIDNLETRDDRRLLRGTCFSIEPGVYLKGEFGVRSEVDVYLGENGPEVTGGPIQEHVIPILGI